MAVSDVITVLDHIDHITVPGDVFREPANEYWALLCMRDGMEFLNQQAARCDNVARERLNPGNSCHGVSWGNDPHLKDIPKSLLTCSFHWYAMSAYQYALLVGAIARQQDDSRPLPSDYVKKVMPEIQAFRDKVAAHFVWAKRNSKDNDADRLASVIPPLAFKTDSFYVGEFTPVLPNASDPGISAIQPWSITKAHQSLRERYWPDTASKIVA